MKKEKIKVYTYKRVSTAMQIDGYSLDAQRARMKAYADFNDYEIVGEYEDAGKSGKSIEGRLQFRQMMEDVKSGKDNISYVLVFKLSRFGRNAADVLSTLQVMQDFGVNLICVEDGIDSSKDAGKLMISVLSAVAEIERENIRVQTMEGRIQKAREGKWNGGFAPYGYQLVNGKLEINEEEAEIVRLIFQKYVYEGYGVKRICNYLVENNIMGRNGKNIPTTTLVRMVRNKTYLGYLINGNVEKECPELRIIEPEVFEKAQELRDARRREKGEDSDSYSPHALLCGKVFCAHCGNRLNITSSGRTRLRADGSTVKEKRFRYSCHYNVRHPGQCDGQSGYGVTKLDAIVESIVCTKFSEILECSKSKLLQDMLRKDMEVAQKEVSRAKSELDLKDDERNALKDEMIRVIRGKSSIDRDMIQQLLDENQAAIQAAQDALTAAQNKPVEVTETEVVVTDPNIAPRTVFFKIGSAEVSPREVMNISYLAKQMQEFPNTTYTVNGYADSATGTPEFNKELSLKRAQAVVDVLVKDYGIPANRLKISADGGVDKFGQPILNRVVLVKSAN